MSPAAQMRYGCAEQLRRRGFGTDDLDELARLRAAFESQQRGDLDRDAAQAVVDEYADRPWFELVYVPRRLPLTAGAWADMDYDPAKAFSDVRCPVLAFYGERDEWVPIDESIAALHHAAGGRIEMSMHRLAGCDHHPSLDDRRDIDGISPDYTATLSRWVSRQVERHDR